MLSVSRAVPRETVCAAAMNLLREDVALGLRVPLRTGLSPPLATSTKFLRRMDSTCVQLLRSAA